MNILNNYPSCFLDWRMCQLTWTDRDYTPYQEPRIVRHSSLKFEIQAGQIAYLRTADENTNTEK